MSGSAFDSDSGESSGDVINTSCQQYDTTKFKWAAALRAGVGLSSLIVCVVVIGIIFCYKKYMFFTQRLVLYLSITSLLHSLSYTLSRIKFTGQRSMNDHYCLFAGFLELYSGWVEVLVICFITLNIFSVALHGSDTSKFELLLVSLCFTVPVLWCWVPYVQLTYGSNGPWCGIRVFNNDCSEHNLGGYMRFFLWQIPLYIGLVSLYFITWILVIVRLNKAAGEWEGSHFDPSASKQKKKLVREFKHFIWYPIVFLMLELPLLISQIYEAVRPHDPMVVLWILEAVTRPLAGVAMVIIYGFDSQTRSLLRRLEIMNTCRMCYKRLSRKKEVTAYDMEVDSRYGDSVEGDRARRTVYEERRIAAVNGLASDHWSK